MDDYFLQKTLFSSEIDYLCIRKQEIVHFIARQRIEERFTRFLFIPHSSIYDHVSFL